VACVLVPADAGAPAGEIDDPFPLRNQLPFNLMFLDQTPRAARLLPPRQLGIALHLSYESTLAATDDLVELFRQDDFATFDGRVTRPNLESVAAGTPGGTAFVLDGETLRAALDLRLGLARRLEAGLEIPLLSHSGGFLDSLIEGYHERLDLPDGGRPAFARDRFRAGYVGDGESIFFDHAPGGVRLGDLVISVRGALLAGKGRWPGVTGTLSLKLPTGDADRLHGSGSADYAASIQLTRRIARSTLHAGYAHTFIGDWEIAPSLPLRDSRSLFAACAFPAGGSTTLAIQVLRSSGPFPHREGGDLGRTAQEIVVGLRHRLPGGSLLEWGIIENLSRDSNTPDIGAFLGISRRRRISSLPAQPIGSSERP
jgi:hypothetical protein